MSGNSTRENRETPSTPVIATGRLRQGMIKALDLSGAGEIDVLEELTTMMERMQSFQPVPTKE